MLHVTLFSRFGARSGARAVRVREGSKAQDLLVYLLLHRRRPHAREAMACLLWNECSAEQSRAYFRKALWQVQRALSPPGAGSAPLLRVDPTWVQVEPGAELWLDVEAFECAYERTRGVPGGELDAEAARGLAEAVRLYGGGLLQDRYHEWCLVERERLRHLHLVMLEKLMEYGEAHGGHESALLYGHEILGHDAAREQTHRQMMRLHHLRGDRAAALRQYRTCVQVLEAELGVQPLPETVKLYEEIRSGDPPSSPSRTEGVGAAGPDAGALRNIVDTLGSLEAGLACVRRQTEALALSIHPNLPPPEAGSTPDRGAGRRPAVFAGAGERP